MERDPCEAGSSGINEAHVITGTTRAENHPRMARTAKHLSWAIALWVLLVSTPAHGVKPSERDGPVPIGMLTFLWGPTTDMMGLRDGLVELGYRQDEHFTLGARSAEGNVNMLEAIVRQLVRDGAEIIYVSGWNALQAAQGVTADVPIVFSSWSQNVRASPFESLAGPGGNVTGVTNPFDEVSPEALGYFLLLIPELKRVLFPYDANVPHLSKHLAAFRNTAKRLGIELVERPVHSQQEAKRAITSIRNGDVGGILPASGSLNIAGYALQASTQQKIPTMFSRAWMAEYGGLASYGPSWYGLGRHAARLVDKILKGAKPGDIPVEVNNRMELVINLRTAKALGISISPKVLSQADRIIR